MRILITTVAALILLTGCIVAGKEARFSAGTATGIENNKNEFLELNNGEIVEGEIGKNKLKNWNFVTGRGNVVINGKEYVYKEVKAYQTQNIYHRQNKDKNFCDRIIKGPINLYIWNYTQSVYGSKGTWSTIPRFLYYLQKGDKDPLVEFSEKTLEGMISDNKPASSSLENYRAMNKKEKRADGYSSYEDIITLYNRKNK